MQWDTIWINANLATFDDDISDYGIVENAAIAAKDGKITWLDTMTKLSDNPAELASEVIDVNRQWLLPGLIDCHTHIVYAGNRANEFEARLQGKTYAEIAKQGGGIKATVTATRQASFDELYAASLKRVQCLIREGVTTLEIKSGYGLDYQTEEKMLRVAKQLGNDLGLTVQKTYLGAHTIPDEFKNNADDYIELICQEYLPRLQAENLVDAVDVFCEYIAFDLAQTEKVFQAAKKINLPIKIHAEQLSNTGSAKLAAKHNALSADHLEFISEESIQAMAMAGTVATLLPGAFYYLQDKQVPPIALLRKHDVPIAIATDCNPGSSPCTSILLMLNMACLLFGITPVEALRGITINAAKALGLQASIGSLAINKYADFSVWDIQHPCDLVYAIGMNKVVDVVKKGVKILCNS